MWCGIPPYLGAAGSAERSTNQRRTQAAPESRRRGNFSGSHDTEMSTVVVGQVFFAPERREQPPADTASTSPSSVRSSR